MNLSEAGLVLKDIQLGTLDAEADRRLAEYFVKTPSVASTLTFRRTILLGRKGSGKSAIFSQLARLIQEAGHQSVRILQLTPDEYSWSALRQYREQGLLPEQAHANAWKFSIAIEAAASLAAVKPESLGSEKAREALNRLCGFIRQNYGHTAPNLLATASRLLKGIKGFNLSAFGFGAGLQMADTKQPLTPLVIQSLLDNIALVAQEVGVVIALDKLDDSWDGSDESKQLLIGLLKAAKDLNDKFSAGSPAKGIAVLPFLRTDIYEALQFDDKDKHRAYEEHIVWGVELLREMVNERLPGEVTVHELFEAGEMRGSIAPFNYLVKRTFLRPREVIQFLQECIRRAAGDATVITKDQVREAEERYSS